MPLWFWPFLGLLVGAALRTLLPYIATSLEIVAKAENWRAWPRFQPSYLVAFIVAVIGFGVTFLTVPGALLAFLAWEFVPSVALGYGGQDIGRQIVKMGQAGIARLRAR